MRSSCGNCAAPLSISEYSNDYCQGCTTAKHEAEQGYAAEHTDALGSDIIRAGKVALSERSIFARKHYIDPRGFSRTGDHT